MTSDLVPLALTSLCIPGLFEAMASAPALNAVVSPSETPPPPRTQEPLSPPLWRASAQAQRWEDYISEASRHPAFAPASRSDIQGLDPLLEELDAVIDDLRHFKTSHRHTPPVELPTGLLHVGQPGTGKTLGARYIATASQAVFVNVTAFPDLDSLGLTRADIRAMFETAERHVRRCGRPVILFWDEIDKSLSSDSPYLAETIQELSTQLSGLNGRRHGVLMIAATNAPDKIPADLKGRRLKELHFGIPDRSGVAALLKGFISKYPHEGIIDYWSATYLINQVIVPAKIEAWVQEMWRRAVRSARREGRERPVITKRILIDVLLREHLGIPDGRKFTPEEERQIALHEICHAVVGKKLRQRVPIVSMRSSFEQLAHAVLSAHGNLLTEEDFLAQIAALQAGYVAKKLLGVKLLGYGNDLYTAGSHATQLVERYAFPKYFEGFSINGLTWGREGTQRSAGSTLKASQQLTERSEAAIRRICQEQLARAERILRKFGVRRLRWLAEKLRAEKVLLEEDLDRLMAEASKRPH